MLQLQQIWSFVERLQSEKKTGYISSSQPSHSKQGTSLIADDLIADRDAVRLYVDSSASVHLANNEYLLHNVRKTTHIDIVVPHNQKMSVNTSVKIVSLNISKRFYVHLSTNLLSVIGLQ